MAGAENDKRPIFAIGEPHHMSLIVTQIRDAIAWMTLNSPPVNALSMALIDALSDALADLQPPIVRACHPRRARRARVLGRS